MTTGPIQDMATTNGYLHTVMDPWAESEENELMIIDVTSPARSRVVSTLRLSGNYYSRIMVAGNYVYLGSEGRLDVVDVTDPAAPDKVGEFVESSAADYWWSMTVGGQSAYLVRRAKARPELVELLVLDLTDPALPKQIAAMPLSHGGQDMILVGDYAYVLGSDGLSVVDISDPAQPREVGAPMSEAGRL